MVNSGSVISSILSVLSILQFLRTSKSLRFFNCTGDVNNFLSSLVIINFFIKFSGFGEALVNIQSTCGNIDMLNTAEHRANILELRGVLQFNIDKISMILYLSVILT